ncbi:serine/threonine protein kinase [Rhizobium paknamense]|uniref:Nucleotide-binding universal stress UspA family protein n=1 Tax=Rhizobium paknamense TaxID=1206817 RepID=A0ABU0IH22_9HYPH|nr:bifunctional serine/threonine-protein kinase/universal stress protein [Rhizobium paknamense]MDQ0456923.1 nucleotide-binding universal stress UspA family protein [Rhizobium paknamense]
MPLSKLKPGSLIDGFTVIEEAHKGGMARLYSVTHPDYYFPLLMKVPDMSAGTDPAMIVGFEMEQMILPRISGRHVPRFVANGDFSRQPYIVFERLPSRSLYPLLEKLPLPAEEVISLGQRIATALADLHRQHVVHLDIKPSNILLRDSGEAVLIDFGLARHLDLPDLMQEEFRLPYGTAPYMAPEQILGVRSDFRSDIFALGVLLYFFSTGKRPFGDPQRMKGLKKRLWRDPPPPCALRPDLPPPLQEVILRCLEVNPARRYPAAAQLALDLSDLSAVQLTARAEKRRQDGWAEVTKRRLNPDPIELLKPGAATAALANAPIILVALDLEATSGEVADAMRLTVGRIMARSPGARLACLNILKIARIGLDSDLDEQGHNKHAVRLGALKSWAAPLQYEGQTTCHVLESTSPASAILDYARDNDVDHIVMGARTGAQRRALLGSVAGEVASKAPCTVTVVRVRREAEG